MHNIIHKRTKENGFTLIELSIVLVIIGLIIGGILVGNDLIKSAGNRAFVSQLEKYNASVNTFKTKYNCLPGDCASATAYGFTGNGDGNSMVSSTLTEPSWSSADYSITETDSTTAVYLSKGAFKEAQYFWSHLRDASLIPEYNTTLVVADGVGSGFAIPTATNDETGIIVIGWAGKHYFRSGAMATRNNGNVMWDINFSPADAAYIFTKMGGTTITTTNSHGDFYPDGLGKDRIIVGRAYPNWGTPWCSWFYVFMSKGAGGENSNVCIDTSVTPAYFNLKNPKKLCALIIQANF